MRKMLCHTALRVSLRTVARAQKFQPSYEKTSIRLVSFLTVLMHHQQNTFRKIL